ncbi:MAG: Mobile element protein [Streptosporangiaceae bacterium]|nr:Mobile element protein [Streptosporangiaceae bacterium]
MAQARQLTEAREAFGWLRGGSQTVQQQALRDHAQAMTNFFAGTHRKPTWRKAGVHERFRIVGQRGQQWEVRRVSRKVGQVRIPKVGWVAFRWSRGVPEGVKSYRVTRDRAGRWHVAFAAIPDPIPAPGTGEVVGVDRGVVVSAALSTGDLLNVAGLTGREAQRLLRLQRRLARAQRGSNRSKRVKAAVAKLKARECDRRKDWVEQTTARPARRYDVIGGQALPVAAMTRSAKGTLEQPNRNVAAKAGRNRGILANARGGLVGRLEHKAPGRVVKINPRHTSQRCWECGHTAEENRKSQAVFLCVACGHTDNADVNAARNITDAPPQGFGVPAREALQPSAGATNREPQLITS